MHTLKKLSDEKKIRIGATSLGAAHLDKILATFAEDGGEALSLLPLTKEAEAAAQAFFGEALPEGYDRFLIDTVGGARIYYTSEISKCYALYALKENYAQGIGEGMIYGRAYMQLRGYKCYLPPKDKIEEFKEMLELLISLGYNTLTLELVGAAEYKSHPEINEGWEELCDYFAKENGLTGQMQRSFIYPKNSIHVESGGGKVLSVAQLSDIAAFAYERGMEIIPEMPSLSHAEYILYKHPELAEVAEDHFPEVCCPSNPDYYKLLFEIFDDMIEVFRPKRINIGHDELYVLGYCPRCKGKKAADLLLSDITRVHDFLASRGVKTMMWGDKVAKAWHGGNAAFHVRLPQKNGETITFGGKTYERHNFRCLSVPEYLEYVKENPHTEAWFVEETASCIPSLPRDLQIANWMFWEGERHEDMHSGMGLTTVFGNCAPERMKGIRRRCERVGVEGFWISNWGNVDLVSTQRCGYLLSLFCGAHIAWDRDYDENKREALLRTSAAEAFAFVNKKTLAAPHILIEHTCDFEIPHDSFDCGYRVVREDFHIGDYEITYKNGEKRLYAVVWGENIGPRIKDAAKAATALSDRAVSVEPIGTALPVIEGDAFAYRVAIPVSGEVESVRFVKNEKCTGELSFAVVRS